MNDDYDDNNLGENSNLDEDSNIDADNILDEDDEEITPILHTNVTHINAKLKKKKPLKLADISLNPPPPSPQKKNN